MHSINAGQVSFILQS